MKKKLCAAMLALLMVGSSAHSQNLLNETQEQKDKRMEWFYKAKLGIFIHWGVYAVKGVSESWSFYNKYLPHDEYMKQCEGFTASKYDPKAWVELIKESGAQYTIDENLSVRALARYTFTDKVNSVDHIMEYTAGVRYSF